MRPKIFRIRADLNPDTAYNTSPSLATPHPHKHVIFYRSLVSLVRLSLYLIVVVSPGQSLEAVRVEAPAGGVQLLPVVLRQLRPERVDRDDEGSRISERVKITLPSAWNDFESCYFKVWF